MAIDPQKIDEIKSRIDIVDVIGDFVSLKKSGNSYKALSPFTNEKTPSFFVVPNKGIYKCFSSGKGGDAINFIMEYDGLNYIEALKYLGRKYGIELEEEELSDEKIQQQNERDSLYIILNFANDYFMDRLWKHSEGKSVGLSYLKERNYSDEIIKKFQLGYSLDEWDDLLKEALEKGYNKDILEKSGLIVKKGEKEYDRFRGRVIFPIHNLTGKVIAFGARTLKKERKQPKYINSPETEVYHKGKTLYGLHLAKQAVRNSKNCYLVEGYTDVISLHQSGIENVVSSSGTALTEDQIKLIKRYTENVTILFDGDEAGLRASLRGIDMLLEGGLNVKIVVFPDTEDPDSYLKKAGINEFKEFLTDEAYDFISFKIRLYTQEAENDPVKKAEAIKNIVTSIAKIPDPVKRAVYIKETSKMLAIDESILIAEQNKILIRDKREKDKRVIYEKEEDYLSERLDDKHRQIKIDHDDLIAIQERESVRLLINYGLNQIEEEYKLQDYLLQELEDIEFSNPVYKEIFEMFKQELAKGHVVDSKYFIEHGKDAVRDTVVDLVAEKYEVSEQWESHKIFVPRELDLLENMVFTNVLRLKYRVVQKLINENLNKLKETDEPEEQEKLQKIHSELKKSEMEIGKHLGIVVN